MTPHRCYLRLSASTVLECRHPTPLADSLPRAVLRMIQGVSEDTREERARAR